MDNNNLKEKEEVLVEIKNLETLEELFKIKIKCSLKERIEYLFRDIYELITDKYFSIILGIKNLWKYRKVIFSDRPYDGYYIYALLKVKLKYTLKYFEDDTRAFISEDNEHIKETISNCIRDLEIITNYDNSVYEYKYEEVEKAKERLFTSLKDNIDNWWD